MERLLQSLDVVDELRVREECLGDSLAHAIEVHVELQLGLPQQLQHILGAPIRENRDQSSAASFHHLDDAVDEALLFGGAFRMIRVTIGGFHEQDICLHRLSSLSCRRIARVEVPGPEDLSVGRLDLIHHRAHDMPGDVRAPAPTADVIPHTCGVRLQVTQGLLEVPFVPR